MNLEEKLVQMLKKSEAVINRGRFEKTPTNDYIIMTDADGFHFSRSAFTYNELVDIRNYALDLRTKRLERG